MGYIYIQQNSSIVALCIFYFIILHYLILNIHPILNYSTVQEVIIMTLLLTSPLPQNKPSSTSVRRYTDVGDISNDGLTCNVLSLRDRDKGLEL